MNNGLMFGMEGPNMEGTWYNPKTGDSFTVRNSFFQDNQYVVQTTDGRILDYNTLQYYVRADKPIDIPKKNVQTDQLPTEIVDILEDNNSYMLPEDEKLISNTLGNINENRTGAVKDDTNLGIIDKALTKKSIPSLQAKIKWDNFPSREIEFLNDIMDISYDEIIEWYVRKIDMSQLFDQMRLDVKNYIKTKINEGFEKDTPEKDTHEKVKPSKSSKIKKS